MSGNAQGSLTIDGGRGEGGGQVLRSALALSLVTGRPFRITRIRAERPRPGLGRQHLTAVQAAAAIGRAEVTGAAPGSSELWFSPTAIEPGEYAFGVGTAGSTTLVLQTVLPALALATGPSRIVLDGGTHNPFAPPFEFLDRVFLPLLNRMGPRIAARLIRPGFYPAGGGRIEVSVRPAATLRPLRLRERGPVRRRRVTATVARLPRSIAERELAVVLRRLGWRTADGSVEEVTKSAGPGNVVTIEIECQHAAEVITGFGRRGVRAELVAAGAAERARRYLEAEVPVGEWLADQLVLLLALAGGGSFRTLEPSSHTRTNAEVVRRFVELPLEIEGRADDWRIRAGADSADGDAPCG